MIREALLGLDLGTSSVKAVFMDARGETIGSGARGYAIDSPAADWAQQSPGEWWNASVTSVREALAEAKKNAGGGFSVKGISLSGQMHGLVALDADDKPLGPAIIWADRRSSSEVRAVNAAIENIGVEYACNGASTGFLLPSLLWLANNEPDVMDRVRTVMLPKDYVSFRMTGRRAAEPTDASGSGACNVRDGGWNYALLSELGIPCEIFPEMIPTGSFLGPLRAAAAEEMGLDEGIPVAAGAADQPAGALGNGIAGFGMMSSTIGTAGQIFAPVTSPMYDREFRTNTFRHAGENLWYVLGANLSAGYCLKWLKNTANIPGRYADLDKYASRVPAGSRGVVFLPYLFGDRTPHRDERARAVFFGLAGSHGTDEMIRAVMEGVVFSMNEGVELVRGLGIDPSVVVASGGGARSKLWRQMQADVYALPVTRAVSEEQACAGAAILASVGAGIHPDIPSACEAMTRMSGETEEPDMRSHEIYMDIFGIYRELYSRNAELFARMTEFAKKG
ncbi:MAG: xylulokinase [Synergistaceae bacterium]|jgi:xylulokinase|nr:xylulokinase [Synergistaceae bacterium]